MAPVHVKAGDQWGVDPLWIPRHKLPPTSTMVIHSPHRTAPDSLGFGTQYIITGFLGQRPFATLRGSRAPILLPQTLCNYYVVDDTPQVRVAGVIIRSQHSQFNLQLSLICVTHILTEHE